MMRQVQEDHEVVFELSHLSISFHLFFDAIDFKLVMFQKIKHIILVFLGEILTLSDYNGEMSAFRLQVGEKHCVMFSVGSFEVMMIYFINQLIEKKVCIFQGFHKKLLERLVVPQG